MSTAKPPAIVEVDVTLPTPAPTLTADDFTIAWLAGHHGKPVKAGASDLWRDAHAMGAKAAAEEPTS